MARSDCNISFVLQIPNDVKYRTVSRVQTTMSQAKLRRLIKRGIMSDSDISQYQRKMFTKGLNNPYAELVSGSNKQKYRRYIEFGELLDKPVTGQFDHFGLSKIATIPWFS